MALMPCKECGREISDQAVSCPGCGAPVAPMLNRPPVTPDRPPVTPPPEPFVPAAEAAPRSRPSFSWGRVLGLTVGLFVLMVAIIVVLILGGVGDKAPSEAVDDPQLAAQARAAVDAWFATASDGLGRKAAEVRADSEGIVVVNLSFTAEAYLGDSGRGENALDDLAWAIANAVFANVPEASEVAVFDDNNSLLGSPDRTDWRPGE